MSLKGGDRYVRFKDLSSGKAVSPESPSSSPQGWLPIRKPSLSTMMSSIRQGFQKGMMNSLKGSLHMKRNHQAPKESGSSKRKVLDPQGSFLQRWNKIFVLTCIIAVSLDPLFFYIPVIDNSKKCLDSDTKLQIIACVLRSVTDLFYILHIILQFRTGFIPPSSRVFGRGELIEDLPAIAKRYLSSYFVIDVLAVLPIPQVLTWHLCLK